MSIMSRVRARADAAVTRARFLTASPSSPDSGKPFAEWKATRDARGRPLQRPRGGTGRGLAAARARQGRARAGTRDLSRPWRSPAQQPETRAAREQIDRETRELRQERDREQAPGRETRETREARERIDQAIRDDRIARDTRDREKAREQRFREASAPLAARFPYQGSSRDAREARQQRAREGRDGLWVRGSLASALLPQSRSGISGPLTRTCSATPGTRPRCAPRTASGQSAMRRPGTWA